MGRYVVLLVIFLCYNSILFVDRAQCTRNLSKEEEEIDREIHLKLSNKSSIKTILENYGDIDCVDVNKQLAFQHPLLENHTIDFQIISTPLYYKVNEHNISMASTSPETYLRGEMCPVGTIPIRRITKTDQTKDLNRPNTYLAVARTKAGPGRYTGGEGSIKQDSPRATGHQYSAARIRIHAGYNTIEAGWRVDQDLYGDSRSRFFIRTDAGNTHCFNIRCPGFIQTYSRFPLDSLVDPISKPGGPVFELPVSILRDNANGNWNLILGDGDKATLIGYWPPQIFPGMADRVEWGGAAYSPPGTPLPPMGSGGMVRGNPNYDGYVSKITVLNEGGKSLDPDIETFADNSRLYSVRDGGHFKYEGHTILFGGTGHF